MLWNYKTFHFSPKMRQMRYTDCKKCRFLQKFMEIHGILEIKTVEIVFVYIIKWYIVTSGIVTKVWQWVMEKSWKYMLLRKCKNSVMSWLDTHHLNMFCIFLKVMWEYPGGGYARQKWYLIYKCHTESSFGTTPDICLYSAIGKKTRRISL